MKREKEQLRSEQSTFSPMTNAKLQCKNCIFRSDDTNDLSMTKWCDVYNYEDGPKPDGIYVGKPCEYYEKE